MVSFITILNTLLDTIFPVYCIACGKSGKNLCMECISTAPSAERETDRWIFPMFDYRHPPIKKAIWLLKYKGKKSLAKDFAEFLYRNMLQELADLKVMENFKEAILVPLPIDKSRKRERGFNQSELLCDMLIKLDLAAQAGGSANFKLDKNILVKIKDTGHQARIENRTARLKNIVGSFAISNEKINSGELMGRNIILIDDVTTTGATLTEAKKILKQFGARKVIAFTVAH